jgi:putative SOS response-associated peptidase YedK
MRYRAAMCGRYVSPAEAEIERFWHIGRHNWRSPFERVRHARFNVAPQQGNPNNHIPVIRADSDGTLELTDMQWWLLPFWSPEPKIKYSTFNARVESVATSSSFREPFKRRRCLIPARGWYEWQALSTGKQPWFFQAPDHTLLAFAGLWDRWEREDQVIESCTIIVGEPSAPVRTIHDRMPFLIPKGKEAEWLAPDLTDPTAVRALLQPAPNIAVSFHRVSNRVGNVANDGPELMEMGQS